MPSSPISTSARNTAADGLAGGDQRAVDGALGLARPAARQVQDPSAVWLVNSMSIRRDMRRTRYLAWRPSPDAGPRIGIP